MARIGAVSRQAVRDPGIELQHLPAVDLIHKNRAYAQMGLQKVTVGEYVLWVISHMEAKIQTGIWTIGLPALARTAARAHRGGSGPVGH